MIAVDAGNTSIHIAHFKEGKLKGSKKIPTSGVTKTSLSRALNLKLSEKVLVCSVVPKVTKIFKSLEAPVYIAGPDVVIPIKSLYNKKQIGMDRLVGAYAAKKLFSGTRLVLDFGTAITLDFLSKTNLYQGGLILPGVGSTLRVFANCALLPNQTKFEKTKRIIPITTEDSIAKGLTEGFSLMINSLVKKYKKKLKIAQNKEVIVTGGEAKVIMPNLDFSFKYEPLLVLKGLEILSHNLPSKK
ncbi:MAG: type III pantothenate kinase [Candidatus Omnitrophica bacterium]|nr:type III pantothenate kinase [Candidatus Omnitrophota bacterium]